MNPETQSKTRRRRMVAAVICIDMSKPDIEEQAISQQVHCLAMAERRKLPPPTKYYRIAKPHIDARPDVSELLGAVQTGGLSHVLLPEPSVISSDFRELIGFDECLAQNDVELVVGRETAVRAKKRRKITHTVLTFAPIEAWPESLRGRLAAARQLERESCNHPS